MLAGCTSLWLNLPNGCFTTPWTKRKGIFVIRRKTSPGLCCLKSLGCWTPVLSHTAQISSDQLRSGRFSPSDTEWLLELSADGPPTRWSIWRCSTSRSIQISPTHSESLLGFMEDCLFAVPGVSEEVENSVAEFSSRWYRVGDKQGTRTWCLEYRARRPSIFWTRWMRSSGGRPASSGNFSPWNYGAVPSWNWLVSPLLGGESFHEVRIMALFPFSIVSLLFLSLIIFIVTYSPTAHS
jgi:hypothetical protein